MNNNIILRNIKKKTNKKPAEKEVPKVEEVAEKGQEKKKPATTQNVFNQLAGEDEENEEDDN